MLNYSPFVDPHLRVLFLVPSLGAGGAERWVVTLCKSFATVRPVGVVTLRNPPGELTAHLPPQVPCLPCPHNGDWVAHVRHAVEKTRPDIILTWGVYPTHDLRDLSVPIVCVSHSDPDDRTERWQLDKLGVHFLAGVSRNSLSLFSEDALQRTAPKVLHNGVEIDRIMPRFGRDVQRELWKIHPNRKVLLYVGRFSREKNPQQVLRTLQALPDGWVAVMYGWGDLAADLREKAADLPVLFPQPRTDFLGDIYAAADVVMVPSYTECCPLVLLEALLARRPVISSVLPFLREFVFESCWQVPVDAPIASWVDAVRTAASSPASTQDLSRFSSGAMAARWEAYLYESHQEWLNAGRFGAVYGTSPLAARYAQFEAETLGRFADKPLELVVPTDAPPTDDYLDALMYQSMGIPADLFTPTPEPTDANSPLPPCTGCGEKPLGFSAEHTTLSGLIPRERLDADVADVRSGATEIGVRSSHLGDSPGRPGFQFLEGGSATVQHPLDPDDPRGLAGYSPPGS
jgi:glycosyltransferase involved in cell wall biosynthesis